MGIDGVYSPVENPLGYLFDQVGIEGPHQIDVDRFGGAIEAAATGLPSGTVLDAGLEVPLHDPNQADFTERLMEYATENDELFSAADGRLAPVLDNFGDITAHYMADIHQAMNLGGEGAWLPDSNGIPHSNGIPLSIAEGGTDNRDLAADWLRVVGQDPEALATAWATSEGMLFAEVATAGQTDDWKLDSQTAMELHAQVSAALTEGGLNAIADGIDADADIHNADVDAWARPRTSGRAWSSAAELARSPAPSSAPPQARPSTRSPTRSKPTPAPSRAIPLRRRATTTKQSAAPWPPAKSSRQSRTSWKAKTRTEKTTTSARSPRSVYLPTRRRSPTGCPRKKNRLNVRSTGKWPKAAGRTGTTRRPA